MGDLRERYEEFSMPAFLAKVWGGMTFGYTTVFREGVRSTAQASPKGARRDNLGKKSAYSSGRRRYRLEIPCNV